MRSILSNFPTEKIRIIKQDLSVISDVNAFVDTSMIFIDDATLLIEEGDIIERSLPSGANEQYLVIDRGFHRGVRGIPDHYQVKVEKKTAYTKISSGHVINYNIGKADRININSTDNSTNYHISAKDISVMDSLRDLAKGLENEEEIITAVDNMQESVGTKSFTEKYNAFIQCAANHMTLFAPFIPALTALLSK